MKFKARVAVHRGGKFAYWTKAAIALRLCEARLAVRKDKESIELPAINSESDKNINALAVFGTCKPQHVNCGGHTTPNMDRKNAPPCFYRADTGQTSATRQVYMRSMYA